MYLRELSGSKFHFVTSSNVILYNDVKNSIFIKGGFIWFWKWGLQLYMIKIAVYFAVLVAVLHFGVSLYWWRKIIQLQFNFTVQMMTKNESSIKIQDTKDGTWPRRLATCNSCLDKRREWVMIYIWNPTYYNTCIVQVTERTRVRV